MTLKRLTLVSVALALACVVASAAAVFGAQVRLRFTDTGAPGYRGCMRIPPTPFPLLCPDLTGLQADPTPGVWIALVAITPTPGVVYEVGVKAFDTVQESVLSNVLNFTVPLPTATRTSTATSSLTTTQIATATRTQTITPTATPIPTRTAMAPPTLLTCDLNGDGQISKLERRLCHRPPKTPRG